MYSVAVIPKEIFERKVLLQPFEERFDLPTSSVSFADYSRLCVQVIGYKGYCAFLLVVFPFGDPTALMLPSPRLLNHYDSAFRLLRALASESVLRLTM